MGDQHYGLARNYFAWTHALAWAQDHRPDPAQIPHMVSTHPKHMAKVSAAVENLWSKFLTDLAEIR